MEPNSRQFPKIKPIATGEGVPKLDFATTEPAKNANGNYNVIHSGTYSFIGGAAGRMKAVANSAREDAETVKEVGIDNPDRNFTRVQGGSWRPTDTKEGRRALAGDLGLPNTKKKKK